MRQTMEISELLEVLGERKKLILITTVIFMTLGAIYGLFFTKPSYRAETTLIVSSLKGTVATDGGGSIDLGTVSVNQAIAITYGQIIKSRAVLEPVIEELGLETSYEELLSSVSSGPVEATEIIKISAEAGSRKDAVIITNKITEVFIEEVVRTLKVNNVEIIDEATALPYAVNRGPLSLGVIATAVGIVVGIMLSLIVDYRDNTIKTVEDIEKNIGISVIGSIPDFGKIKEN